MISLHSNLSLQNLDSEEFSVEKNFLSYGLSINPISSLQESDRIVYNSFINMLGNANVLITDIPGETDDVYSFFRYFNFEHDSNFNIVGLVSYLKPYTDFNDEEKTIIDSFLQMISSYSN
jgi:hypothetical protein